SLEKLLLLAFPDRVCRRRSPETATLVNGGGVTLADSSAVRGDWFLALDARRGSFARAQQAEARLVSPIEVEWLDELLSRHVTTEQSATWDGTRVVAVRQKRYRDLVLAEQRGGKVEADVAAEFLQRHLASDGDVASFFLADDALATLWRRLELLTAGLPSHLKPGDEPPQIEEAFADACLTAASEGKPTPERVRSLTRDFALARLAGSRWGQVLSEHAPKAIEVPSGSRIKLDWSVAADGAGPVLAVRIQELFGLAATPRVCGGAVPVTLHLLAPNMRPQQVTDDLASFWRNTYPQVRKDLRARYPKHDWPEDPMTATPRRGAKRRK
ncbi:MAG: ATP-dependent helicase C-terminal domain-containing protein, partial [Planctomycetota bacterium]